MRKTLLLVFLSILISDVFSQQWSPPGATWWYGYFVANTTGDYGFKKWSYNSDSLVLGKDCKVITSYNLAWVTGDPGGSDLDTPFVFITYEDSGVVHWYREDLQIFTILYDFNKNKGEQYVVEVDSCQNVIVMVDSTDTEMINGFSRKIQYVSSLDSGNSPFNGKVIEGIGNTIRPLPDYSHYCVGGVIDGKHYLSLRCYEDDSTGHVQFHNQSDCESTGIDEGDKEIRILLYPNPVGSILNIETQLTNYTFVIHNAMGQVLLEKELSGDQVLDVGKLLPGIHITTIRTQGVIRSGPRFIKK